MRLSIHAPKGVFVVGFCHIRKRRMWLFLLTRANYLISLIKVEIKVLRVYILNESVKGSYLFIFWRAGKLNLPGGVYLEFKTTQLWALSLTFQTGGLKPWERCLKETSAKTMVRGFKVRKVRPLQLLIYSKEISKVLHCQLSHIMVSMVTSPESRELCYRNAATKQWPQLPPHHGTFFSNVLFSLTCVWG